MSGQSLDPANCAIFYAIVPAADRRQAARRPSGIAATLSQFVGGIEVDRIEALVTETSATGLSIRSPVPLQRGAIYHLQIPTRDQCCIRIARSRPQFDGSHRAGALFI